MRGIMIYLTRPPDAIAETNYLYEPETFVLYGNSSGSACLQRGRLHARCWDARGESVTIVRREVEANLDLIWRRLSPLIARPCLIEIGVYTTCK